MRTVRTAASAIAESIRSEVRAQRRKKIRQKTSSFFRKSENKKLAESKESVLTSTAGANVPGLRRNVYVNHQLSAMEVDRNGEPTARYARNKVRTSSE